MANEKLKIKYTTQK